MEATPVPVSQEELKNLFAEKGELVTQLEIAQNKLQQVNMRIGQLLNLNQQPLAPIPPK